MCRLLLTLLLCLPALAGWVEGRVLDGTTPLKGVRIYPDRRLRLTQPIPPPLARSAGDGSFRLPLRADDAVLVMEKEGYYRDLVPLADLSRPVVLRPVPTFRRDRVLVVRVGFPGEPPGMGEDALRAFLFGRQPGEASVVGYFYEISKGALLLEPGAVLTLADPGHGKPHSEDQRSGIVAWVLSQLRERDLKPFDWADNRTGEPGADGVPDHLWIVVPGPTSAVTVLPEDLPVRSSLSPLPWDPSRRWPVVFFTEESPLGPVVHEMLHAQGEHRVDDFYVAGRAATAGTWDVMDAGQWRGWDQAAPGRETAHSPAQPMGWTRAELWYGGFFRDTIPTATLRTGTWEGWLDPLVRAPQGLPQRLVVQDPRKPGRFWELSVRRPWGFDRGRVGGRWGPGYEGLVVARIDPALLSTDGPSRGPVQVLDAHPGTQEPPVPRYPGGRWQLDDAAFNVGKGERPGGTDGPLRWQVLEADASGRMKVRVVLGK